MTDTPLDIIVAGQPDGCLRIRVPTPGGYLDCTVELGQLSDARDKIRCSYIDHKNSNKGRPPVFLVAIDSPSPSEQESRVADHLREYVTQLSEADATGRLQDTRVRKRLGT
jgi:hypothetical protein